MNMKDYPTLHLHINKSKGTSRYIYTQIEVKERHLLSVLIHFDEIDIIFFYFIETAD